MIGGGAVVNYHTAHFNDIITTSAEQMPTEIILSNYELLPRI